MLRPKNEAYVGLDELFGTALPQEPAPRRGVSVAAGVISAVLTGMLLSLVVMPGVGLTLASGQVAEDYWNTLPAHLPEAGAPQRSVIVAADGTKIGQFFTENRIPVSGEQIPKVMKQAIVAIEDSRFYEHHGFDERGTARAVVSNVLNDSTQGGSTITQQLVKNTLATAATTDQERAEATSRTSYLRKLRELKYAVELERTRSKDQILTDYLNIAYFGDGAYGVGAAARHYFSVDVSELNLPQSALLAGLVRNPVAYNPVHFPGAARERRDLVLARMLQLTMVGPTRIGKAQDTALHLKVTEPRNGCVDSPYPFFCQWVREELVDEPALGATAQERQDAIRRGGLVVHTSLDPRKQDIAQQAVDAALGRDNRVAMVSVSVEPGTGKVVSMAFNRTFGTPDPKTGGFDKTQIVLSNSRFQPGSTFKMFTLATALERGYDVDSTWNAPSVYRPSGLNYPGSGFANSTSSGSGVLSAKQALWRSSNTFFVHLQEQVGVLAVADMAARLGITTLPRTGPGAIGPRDGSLTLGSYEVTPVEMAGAYATFAASGVHCTPSPLVSIDTPDGTLAHDHGCHQAIEAAVADAVATTAAGTIDGPDPARTGKDMSIGRQAAGKTGTTQGNAAVWFAGFTPDFATVVEASDPRGGFRYPLVGIWANGSYVPRAYGSLVSGPVWKRIMAAYHQGVPEHRFPTPSAVTVTPALIPDVTGLDATTAYRTLTQAGYRAQVVERSTKPGPFPVGTVAATVPARGSFAAPGTEVSVLVAAPRTPDQAG